MNIDAVNKWLSAGASIAVIIGVVIAIVAATVATITLRQTQQVASADLVLRLRATLDDNKFVKLVADLQNHDHKYRLLSSSDGGKGGKFHDLLIEQYISVFEDIGYLVEGDLIINKMAYNEFSYDVEKAWCNDEVQGVITDARKADKSITRQTDSIYGEFETLARSYLVKEGNTCEDLDNQ
jgi:hypothetical protein